MRQYRDKNLYHPYRSTSHVSWRCLNFLCVYLQHVDITIGDDSDPLIDLHLFAVLLPHNCYWSRSRYLNRRFSEFCTHLPENLKYPMIHISIIRPYVKALTSQDRMTESPLGMTSSLTPNDSITGGVGHAGISQTLS